ncbi:MAG: putative enzyme related to lactoylglutathione lyase [Roseivirga sp.]|jgi:predicted enzyme related to lactoylglutathione lyase
MYDKEGTVNGTIGWIDLTVSNAENVKDFCAEVTGWKPEPVSMGDYNDYNMTANGEPKAGVCHKKGSNKDIPSQWMIYINAGNLDQSVAAVTENGGKLLSEIKSMGAYGRTCYIEDPAGAVCALFEPA